MGFNMEPGDHKLNPTLPKNPEPNLGVFCQLDLHEVDLTNAARKSPDLSQP